MDKIRLDRIELPMKEESIWLEFPLPGRKKTLTLRSPR